MTNVTLTSVYVANGLGIVILLTMIFGNIWSGREDRDIKNLVRMMIVIGLACVADMTVFTLDGHPGLQNTVILYLGNSWLFFANILTAYFWVDFVAKHLHTQRPKLMSIVMDVLMIIGVICLIVNLFVPIIFSLEDNMYARAGLFWIYVSIEGLFILNSFILYGKVKRVGGYLKFFPLYVFLLPVVIGTIVQSLFYGVSVGWACAALAMNGSLIAMKDEMVFQDHLTGLYNRAYLDYLKKIIPRGKYGFCTGIMLDINGFKAINDRYGHAEGDKALVICAEIIEQAVGELGFVIRYAGDEFVILINTFEDEVILQVISNLNQLLNDFNKKKQKPYELSMAMGYATMSIAHEDINDMLNVIDKKMYENKAEYYCKHPRK